MNECGNPRSHWPHPVVIDGCGTTMCTGHGLGRHIFWSWPARVVHLISDLRKVKTAWRQGGM